MLYEVAYYSDFIYINVYSSNGKVRDPCPMWRLSNDSDAIGKTVFRLEQCLTLWHHSFSKTPITVDELELYQSARAKWFIVPISLTIKY
jgi:hypothetical protein